MNEHQTQHQIESLLNNLGSSAEELKAKIHGFSVTQLQTIFHTVDQRKTVVPTFFNKVIFEETMKKTREETMKKTREETMKKAREETLKAAGSVQLSVLRTKLPFCNDYTDSDANVNPKHHPRSRTETTFKFDEVQNIPESVWEGVVNISGEADTIPIQSETSVVIYLHNLYRGIIKALGFEKKIQVIVTRMIAGFECDIVLAAKETFQPLSVTEVKKPHSQKNDKSIFPLPTRRNERRLPQISQNATSRTIGQNFDQLHNIKWMNGSKRVYGMISTGNSFMFTCTDSFESSELVIPPEIFASEREQHDGSGEYRVSPTKPILFNDASGKAPAYFPSSSSDQEEALHTSQVITIHEKESRDAPSRHVVNMLILQVAKAMECLQNLDAETMFPQSGTVFSRQIDLKESNARTGNKKCFTQVTLKENWQECRKQYVDASVTTVNLIRTVGSGASGDCCFAVSESQDRSCVVKFFQAAQDTTTLAQAKEEKKNWDRAYGTDVFETLVLTLGEDRGRLAMPYVDIAGVDRDMCLKDEAKELKACLKRFSCENSEAGRYLLHRDVKWRHLGYLQEKLTLVDLGSVQETQDRNEWSGWMESCVKELVKSKGSGRRKRRRKS